MDAASLQSYLSHGETLLWSGAPARKFRFERKHLPFLFFLLPFVAFMILPVIGVFVPDKPEQKTDGTDQAQVSTPDHPNSSNPPKKTPLVLRIFTGFFFLCFFGGVVGMIFMSSASQFGSNAFLRGQTAYGVTNQRLIVVTGKKTKIVQSLHLGTATDIRMKEWPDGLGTIRFGSDLTWPYAMSMHSSGITLENIPNPREVFQLIIQARG